MLGERVWLLRASYGALHHPRGGVLLMHDTPPWSVAAFPLILDEIAARNAAFVDRGEELYEVVGLERFYEPLRAAPARTRRRR